MTESACMHHWILGAPAGTETTGICRTCGETRVFQEQAGTPLRSASRSRLPLKGAPAASD